MRDRSAVAQVTTAHRADDVRIFRKHATTLAAEGYRVVLIHPGSETAEHEGVRLMGTSLSGSRAFRFFLGGWRSFRLARRCNALVFHFHDPDLLPWGLLWRATGGVAIYDVHEDVPLDIMRKEWIPRPLRPMVSWVVRYIEEWIAARLDAVVAATPAIARRFEPRRTWLVRNCPRGGDSGIAGVVREDPEVATFVYAGLLSFDRGLGDIVSASKAVARDVPVRLVLAGPIGIGERQFVVESSVDGEAIEYLGVLSGPEVSRLYSRATAGLHFVEPQPQFLESIPVKVLEYMRAGIPFVISEFPLWKEMLAESQGGYFVPPGDVAALERVMREIVADPAEARRRGGRGRDAADRAFRWEVEAVRLLECYDRVAPGVR